MKITVRQLKQLIKEQMEAASADSEASLLSMYDVLKQFTSRTLSKALGVTLLQYAKEFDASPDIKSLLSKAAKNKDYGSFMSALIHHGENADGSGRFSTKEEAIETLKSWAATKDNSGW